ncbi:hypothetical protein HK101_002191 [Irineochytrium annulatum]|nr:hypothetical protein HK101_002191 [Irineochytrium annulatum]
MQASLQVQPTPMPTPEPSAWCILRSENPAIQTHYLNKTSEMVTPAEDHPVGGSASAGAALGTSVSTSKGVGSAGESYLIGRSKECDIVLSNQQQLSKRHCLVFRETKNENGAVVEQIFVEDLSTNGTYVNNVRVANGKRVELKNGDSLKLALYDPKKKMAKFDDRFWIVGIPQVSGAESVHDVYQIGNQLGSGNFATVKVATHRTSGMKYAIKILDKKRLKGKPKMVESIRREVSLLMAVNHPCIINIGGVYDEPDFIYIVLELVRGGELFDLIIDKKKFTETETRVIMTQLFTALKYLHERNIVHRDLKPENILLFSRQAGDLRIKISDFGLAKLVGDESFMKTLCGTPNYVAPEVLTPASGRAYGKAVDLWSSGVVLYICLCGFPPFSDDLAPPPMTDQIKQGKYDFPSPFWDAISPEAVDLCKKLMTVNPDERLTAEQALEHPWMKKDLDEKDENLKPLYSSSVAGHAGFTRNDTMPSPAQAQRSLNSTAPRRPAKHKPDGTGVTATEDAAPATATAEQAVTDASAPSSANATFVVQDSGSPKSVEALPPSKKAKKGE